jgi:L-ascorbate metabolism protein UlaG (beta-lactamase superfamily)
VSIRAPAPPGHPAAAGQTIAPGPVAWDGASDGKTMCGAPVEGQPASAAGCVQRLVAVAAAAAAGCSAAAAARAPVRSAPVHLRAYMVRALGRAGRELKNDRMAVTMEIRFLGHAAFELDDGSTSVLIDPFLTGNPKAAVAADELSPDALLLTHGHADHIGDTVSIAKRAKPEVVAIVEIANELSADGVENVHDPNLGGTVRFDWGWVKLVPAWHTSTTPKGAVNTPAGLIVNFGGKTIYHVGDTSLFSDLSLVAGQAERAGADGIDVALMCIGGHYTMDRFDAVEAARLVGARLLIPCHYDTFPPIETDAQAFKADVEGAGHGEVVVLEPGASHRV